MLQQQLPFWMLMHFFLHSCNTACSDPHKHPFMFIFTWIKLIKVFFSSEQFSNDWSPNVSIFIPLILVSMRVRWYLCKQLKVHLQFCVCGQHCKSKTFFNNVGFFNNFFLPKMFPIYVYLVLCLRSNWLSWLVLFNFGAWILNFHNKMDNKRDTMIFLNITNNSNIIMLIRMQLGLVVYTIHIHIEYCYTGA